MILDFIVSTNMARRHLNPGQRAMVALAYEAAIAATVKAGRPKDDGSLQAKSRRVAETSPDLDSESREGKILSRTDWEDRQRWADKNQRKSTALAAKVAGASRSAVAQAKAVQRDAPDLADKVRAGELALDAADRQRKQRVASRA